ncbi:predicted protein [Chaetomium globosum CBS 148.51]|uniref:Peptidase C45 hydrolase domain-containing protein n=1 Tax=Chaetomium globosum (strain ATCC 6205 / CBS 148.51 / DSM 1962 / NBRC 6347 / NRRL 1970) TaxID=306901 RepID=Q2GY96_CHAGB|nr:uncharacterized protein CHGG_07058 [Chaetomium globosum CBS 148.51]EAQ85805.1 predicted protein [Chaetomium globosum CBS 148.51]
MEGCGTVDNPVSVEAYVYDGKPEHIIGVVLTGPPEERGRTYGRWLRHQIQANVDWHKGHPHLPLWDTCVKIAEAHYLPGLREYWTGGWRELQGMSETSGVPVAHLVVLNARDDIAALVPFKERASESTSVFFSDRATANNTPIVAQSWTSVGPPRDTEFLVCIKIKYPIAENKADIIMVTEAGRISGCGMNAKGMVATGNRLFSTDDGRGTSAEGFFPRTCFERFVLEYNDIDTVPYIPDDTPANTSRHILAVDKTGRYTSLELGPEHIFSHRGEFLVHGNHFQSFHAFCHRRELQDRYRGKWSQTRVSRFNELIKRNEGGVSRQQIMDMFSDHKGRPESICQHVGSAVDCSTMAFVMFDVKRRVISLCKGPPCSGVMSHFTFDGGEAAAADNKRLEGTKAGPMGSKSDSVGTKEETNANNEARVEAVSKAACPPSPRPTPARDPTA